MNAPGQVLEIRSLSKRFGETPVLDRVDLTLGHREFLGIIGPNGGGKTVLLKLIMGLLTPDDGTIRVLGKSPEEARGLVGYVPQYARFDLGFPLSVLDVTLTGHLRRGRLLPRYSGDERRRARETLEQVELGGLEGRLVGELSGGQLQRLLIARALVSRPQLLLLDEPTASLDPQMGVCVHELLAALSREMTVILVSHDISLISGYIRSIACVNRELHYHEGSSPTPSMLEAAYHCPVHIIPAQHDHDHVRREDAGTPPEDR